jgi:hypothetical protein
VGDRTEEPGAACRAFLESIQQFAVALGLAVLIIYMLLAAQFESLIHPITVMVALPLSMVGALDDPGGAAGGDRRRTRVTLLVVPALYVMLDDMSDWVRGRFRRRQPAEPSGSAREHTV